MRFSCRAVRHGANFAVEHPFFLPIRRARIANGIVNDPAEKKAETIPGVAIDHSGMVGINERWSSHLEITIRGDRLRPMPEADQLIPWTQPFLDEVNWRLHCRLTELMDLDASIRSHALKTVSRWLKDDKYASGARADLELWKNQMSSLSDAALKEVMLDRSEEGVLHRSNSPFAGVIPDEQRLQILEGLEHEIACASAA